MQKKSGTVRYTAKQIEAKIARGEDRTDWLKATAAAAGNSKRRYGPMLMTFVGNPTGRRPSWASPLRKTTLISASTMTCWSGSGPEAEAISPHFLFEVGLNRRMIGPTPVFMRFCGAKDTAEACTQWVNNKTSRFSSLSTLL